MADRFFQKIANDVLEASEKISARLEDGISAIFSGELPASGQPDDPNRAGGQPNDDPASSFPSGGVGGDTDYGSSHAFEETIELLEDEEAYGGTPLEGIARGVIGNIMANQAGPQTAWDHFHAFRHAITWTEPFVVSLLAFHFCMLFACLFVSRRGRGMYPRLVVMILIGLLVRSAERLNLYGAQHWREFATQNYFDGQGIFVAVMVCGPLLLFSFIMLVFFLREAAQLLVQVKTAEIKRTRRMQDGGDKKGRRKKEQ